MKAAGLQESQFSNILVNWKKFVSAAEAFQKSQFSSYSMYWEDFGSIHSPRSTFQNPNFESMDEVRKNMS